jgi:hypothetical protein
MAAVSYQPSAIKEERSGQQSAISGQEEVPKSHGGHRQESSENSSGRCLADC